MAKVRPHGPRLGEGSRMGPLSGFASARFLSHLVSMVSCRRPWLDALDRAAAPAPGHRVLGHADALDDLMHAQVRVKTCGRQADSFHAST